MAQSVTQPNTVYLNGKWYPITEAGVRPGMASLYPPKRVSGDFTADSDPRRSVARWSHFTSGVGFRKSKENEFDKLGYSSLWTISDGIVTLEPKVTEATSSAVSGSITALAAMNASPTAGADKFIFVALNAGTDVYAYDDANDDWDINGAGPTKLHDLPGSAAATDAINFVLSGTEYLAFAVQDNWSYTSTADYTTWVDKSKHVSFFTFWDGKLWGIGNQAGSTGQLAWWLDVTATATDDANLQNDFAILDGDVTGMFVGPDATGEPIIYVSTKIGLFAHDSANGRFLKTSMSVPRGGTYTGKGARSWNGSIYFPDGLSVYEYNPRQGFYRDIGFTGEALPMAELLDSVMGTQISATADAGWALLVAVDSNNPQGIDGDGDGMIGITPHVFGWNGLGWHSVAKAILRNDVPIEAMIVSDAYSVNRVWMALTVSAGVARLQHATLPRVLTHPIGFNTVASNNRYGALNTPWFDSGDISASKLALSVSFDVNSASADQTIIVTADINDDDGTVNAAIGTVTSAGVTTFAFPDNGASANEGTAFNSIRFRLRFTSDDSAKSPKLQSITFEYRKKLSLKQRWTFEVDLSQGSGDQSVLDLYDNLIAAAQSNTLVTFNYEERTGSDTTRDALVDVESF